VVEALRYGESLSDDIRAVYVDVDSASTEKLKLEWYMWGGKAHLVVLESPYRSLIGPLLSYIDALDQQSPDDTITIVLPELLPARPYTELLEWTASADIGLTIFPPDYSQSIRFTLPNKLFEYVMAGLPVLSAQLDAIAEIIKNYDIGQVAPSLAPSDLGSAITAMLADRVALARMRNHALEVAREEFHWEKESQKLIELYDAILCK